MIVRSLASFAALTVFSQASPVKSGHASAEWITGSISTEGGKPIQTGIRMIIDEGWHSYWINPGESGMPLKVVWDLPEGWTASEVAYPAPKKFLTGELPGFGYEGEVVFPITLTPPVGATGPVEFGAKVSWLTCNDSSCIPGKVELKLSPAAGTPANGEAITKFSALVPKPVEGLVLEVSESGDSVSLALSVPEGSDFDPSAREAFPVTEQALDHHKPILFQKEGGKWVAKVAKNPYADGTLKELGLVFAGKDVPPVEVAWKAK